MVFLASLYVISIFQGEFFHSIIFLTSGIKIYISHELISHKSQLWNLFSLSFIIIIIIIIIILVLPIFVFSD